MIGELHRSTMRVLLHLLVLLAVSAAAKDGDDMHRGPVGAAEGAAVLVDVVAGNLGFAAALLLSFIVWNRCIISRRPSKIAHSSLPEPAAADEEEEEEEDPHAVTNMPRPTEPLRRASFDRLAPATIVVGRPVLQLTFSDLMRATADFHPDRIIAVGSARLGTSYKAVLGDGTAVTVKRLRPRAGGSRTPPFESAETIGRVARLRHPNLAPLLGFCGGDGDGERLLVYEHVPRGALASRLRSLDWPARLKIAIGAARGLTWLHHWFRSPFIHHHLSPSTILLGEGCEAKITEFGLAGLVEWSRGCGEPGYAAPECAANPAPTAKGDVYALGAVLLELATGRKPGEIGADADADAAAAAGAGAGAAAHLVDWPRKLAGRGGRRIEDAIDESLRGKGHDVEIAKLLEIAVRCVASSPKERLSMYGVYRSLRNVAEGHGFLDQFEEIPHALS